jgi:tetratricopeptide (TPR) repeat protein
MRPRISDQHKTESPRRTAAWPAILFAVAAAVWTALMVASLEWRFLDRFIVGSWHGNIGSDFFQIPRGYKNLLIGNNIFLTDISTYGPYATMYLNHPFLAVAVGPWTAPLAPWTAFWLFVVFSLGLLLLSAWLLASAFQAPAYRGFAYFAVLCSLPTYLMLWNAQAHIFVVVAVALILSGLMRLAAEPKLEKRYGRWIQLGLVIALLSKPVVILMLPVLFLLPETRRKLLLPLAVYAAVSLLFLLAGGLNPGGYNGIHWLNLAGAGSATRQFFNCLAPMEFDCKQDPGLCSLPTFVDRISGSSIPALFFRIPLVAVLLMSLSPLVLDEREQRLRAVLVTVLLCVLSHYLCFYVVQEYHYTTLLPTLPVLLWLWQRESVPWFRRLLMTSFVVSLLVFLPTPCFLDRQDSRHFENINQLQRVVPAAVAFLCLTVYGMASTWLRRRRPKLVTSRMIGQIWPATLLGAIMAILLGSVLATAYATVPRRLRSMPSTWTNRDFEDHYDGSIAQLQRMVAAEPSSAAARNSLGVILARRGRLEEAIAQFERALEIEPGNAEARSDMAESLAALGRVEEAITHFQKVLESEPNNVQTLFSLANVLANSDRPDEAIKHYQKVLTIEPGAVEVDTSLAIVLAGCGRFAEAASHFRHAANLQPDGVDCQRNWAWLLATCPAAAERNGAEAIARAEHANKLAEGKRPDVLDTLAAAYAEGGRFAEALGAAQQALQLARQRDNSSLADAVRARIALYEAGKPFHEPPQKR